MPVMVVANRKAGVGSTTLATTLAKPPARNDRVRRATPCDVAIGRAPERPGTATVRARAGAIGWR